MGGMLPQSFVAAEYEIWHRQEDKPGNCPKSVCRIVRKIETKKYPTKDKKAKESSVDRLTFQDGSLG